MKKLLAITIALVLMLSLCACQSSGTDAKDDGKDSSSNADTSVPEDDSNSDDSASESRELTDATGYSVGASLFTYNDAMESLNRDAITAVFTGYGGEIEWNDGANDQSRQLSQADAYLAQGVDGLIFDLVEYTTAGSIIAKCKADDIPVVFCDHQPTPEDLNSYEKTWYVGYSNKAAGAMSTGILIDYWNNAEKADRNGDGVMGYVVLQGKAGQSDSEDRTEYGNKTISESGLKAEVLATNYCPEWSKNEGYDLMMSWISSLGIESIDGVYGVSDALATGAIEALQSHGYNTGDPDKYIPVVGIDGLSTAKEAIADGSMLGTCICPNENYATAVVNTLMCALNGYEITEENLGGVAEIEDEKHIAVTYTVATADNIADYLT